MKHTVKLRGKRLLVIVGKDRIEYVRFHSDSPVTAVGKRLYKTGGTDKVLIYERDAL